MAKETAKAQVTTQPGQTGLLAGGLSILRNRATAAAESVAKTTGKQIATKWPTWLGRAGAAAGATSSLPAWLMDWSPTSGLEARGQVYQQLLNRTGGKVSPDKLLQRQQQLAADMQKRLGRVPTRSEFVTAGGERWPREAYRRPSSQDVSTAMRDPNYWNWGELQNPAVAAGGTVASPLLRGAFRWLGAKPAQWTGRAAASALTGSAAAGGLWNPANWKWLTSAAGPKSWGSSMKSFGKGGLALTMALDMLKESFSSRSRGREIVKENLTKKLGREPSPAEMNKAFGWGISSMPAGFQARSDDIMDRSRDWVAWETTQTAPGRTWGI